MKASEDVDGRGANSHQPATSCSHGSFSTQLRDYQAKIHTVQGYGQLALLRHFSIFTIILPFLPWLVVLVLGQPWQLVSLGPKLKGMSYKPKSHCLLRGFMH
jgi:hypothetical protein